MATGTTSGTPSASASNQLETEGSSNALDAAIEGLIAEALACGCNDCEYANGVLGIQRGCDAATVKTAYRDLVKIWHPDLFGTEDTRLRERAEEKTKKVNDAYAKLQKHRPLPHGALEIEEMPLDAAVDATNAAIMAVTGNITSLFLDIKSSGLGNRDAVCSVLGRSFAMQQDTINCLQRLIRRFEREMPSYSRAELDSMLAKVMQSRGTLAEFAVKVGAIKVPVAVSATPKQIKDDAGQAAFPTAHSKQNADVLPASRLSVEPPKGIDGQSTAGIETSRFNKVSAQSSLDIEAAPQSESVASMKAMLRDETDFAAPAATPFSTNHQQAKPSRYRPLWIVGMLCLAVGICIGVIIAERAPESEQPAPSNSPSSTPVTQAAEQPVKEAPIPSKPSPSPAPDELPQTITSATSRTDDEVSIQEAVEGWANAFRARDADHFAACYAPVVEQYFRKKDVSRAQIHDIYQSTFGKLESIYAYEISDLRVEFPEGEALPARATATYDKTWDTSQTNGKRNSGEEIERLTFEKTAEGWKIVREDEIQIVRASRQ